MMYENIKSKTIYYNLIFDDYGIPNRPTLCGSFTKMNYCPWCGKKLPDPDLYYERWFEEIEALGFEVPDDPNIPIEYRSDLWRKNK